MENKEGRARKESADEEAKIKGPLQRSRAEVTQEGTGVPVPTRGATKPPGYSDWPQNYFSPPWCTEALPRTSPSEPLSPVTPETCAHRLGHCKGRQAAVRQTKHLGKRGNSTEEKEQTEWSVLCMCGYV